MTDYLVKRIAQIVVTLFIFLSLLFFLILAQPGNYSDFAHANNSKFTAEDRRRIDETFGTDKPVWQQYLIHIRNYSTANMGISFAFYPREVSDVILERLPRTVMLFVTAAVISFYLGFAVGKVIAWRRGGVVEYAATITGASLYTVFTPWFATMVLWVFTTKAGWFPTGKFLDPKIWRNIEIEADAVFMRMIITALVISIVLLAVHLSISRTSFSWRRWTLPISFLLSITIMLIVWKMSGIGFLAFDILKHMVLPIGTLTLISFGGTMLLTRNSMLETMREDFVLTARAKGLPAKVIRDKHVARNAMLPVVTSFVFTLAFAIDGGVIIETVFSWPGIGQTMVSAVTSRDIPLAIGAFVFTGFLVVSAHFVADLLHMYLHPRLRIK